MNTDRPPRDSPEGTLRDRHVVLGQVELRVANPRKEDLVRIGDRDLMAFDLEHRAFHVARVRLEVRPKSMFQHASERPNFD